MASSGEGAFAARDADVVWLCSFVWRCVECVRVFELRLGVRRPAEWRRRSRGSFVEGDDADADTAEGGGGREAALVSVDEESAEGFCSGACAELEGGSGGENKASEESVRR